MPEHRLWPSGGLWRHGDFLRLWSAQTISQFGSQISALALPLAAIVILDATAFEVSLLSAVEFLPFLLFALPAGVWVDRLRRKPILVLADLGRAVVLASVPLAYLLDALTMWQLYAVGFLVGIGTVFFDVAYQSYLPSLVERSRLVDGNSKLEVSRSGAQLAGPGLAGALVELVTAPYAILADAASFLASAVFLFRIRLRETLPEAKQRPSMRRELVEGFRYLLGHWFQRPVAIAIAISNFFSNVGFSIILVYAVRELGMSAGLIGVVLALGNVGWLTGALAATRLSSRIGIGRTMLGSAILFGPSMLLVPLAPQSYPVPFLVAGMALLTFAVVVFNVTGLSFTQAIVPSRMLGRLNATRRFIVWGVIPLGSVTGGALATTIGLRPTLVLGAVGAMLSLVPLALSPIRGLGRMDEALREHAPPVEPEPARA